MRSEVSVGRREASRRARWFPWSTRHDHRHPVVAAEVDSRTVGERVADSVASFGGSWPFIFIFLGLIVAWMVLNTLLIARVVHHKQFDPYPYIALNLVLSATAGLQAPIIMMSQNRAAARDEALAAHHYLESRQIQQLIESTHQLLEDNTELTKQVHQLTSEIRRLVESTPA